MESDAVPHPIFHNPPPPETRLWGGVSQLRQDYRPLSDPPSALHPHRPVRRPFRRRLAQERSWIAFAEFTGGQVVSEVTKADATRRGRLMLGSPPITSLLPCGGLYAAADEGVVITTTAAKLRALVGAVPQPHFGEHQSRPVYRSRQATALSQNWKTRLGTRWIRSCGRTSAMNTKKKFARCLSHGPTDAIEQTG